VKKLFGTWNTENALFYGFLALEECLMKFNGWPLCLVEVRDSVIEDSGFSWAVWEGDLTHLIMSTTNCFTEEAEPVLADILYSYIGLNMVTSTNRRQLSIYTRIEVFLCIVTCIYILLPLLKLTLWSTLEYSMLWYVPVLPVYNM
jgi:hypothetical protein